MTSNPRAIDAYYTPPSLADAVAQAMPPDLSGAVLDPTVGGGALLTAVEKRFGNRVALYGVDVDATAIRTLRKMRPNWRLSTADILEAKSRSGAGAWRSARASLDAIVLNPPFSYRGNGGVEATYGDYRGRVPPSIRFLITILSELAPRRCIVALLPDGALDADRNRAVWSQIATRYSVERLDRFKSSSFSGARVSTSLVRLIPRAEPMPPAQIAPGPVKGLVSGCGCLELIRGRVQVHSLTTRPPNDPVPFLHTTGLAKNELPVAPGELADYGPLVAVSRVGCWAEPRVIPVGKIVLSDCVIGLRPCDTTQLALLARSVVAATPTFLGAYRGTGAQYLTVGDVERVLRGAGWHPHRVRAGSPPGSCCCPNDTRNPCPGV